MRMIFLVDGDNNIGTGLQGIDLLTEEDTVLVFFGKGQTLTNMKKLCAGTRAQVQYLESVKEFDVGKHMTSHTTRLSKSLILICNKIQIAM